MLSDCFGFSCWELECEASILQRGASDVDILRAKDSRSVCSIQVISYGFFVVNLGYIRRWEKLFVQAKAVRRRCTMHLPLISFFILF